MRKLILALAISGMITPAPGHAQAINMTRVTCGQYLAMAPDQARVFSAWMSGWFNQRRGHAWVNPAAFAENVGSVRQWCTSYPNETIMTGLERSMPQPGPMTGQERIDMSLFTCRQYLQSNPERREFIAGWMSGYFRAARDEPAFDVQRWSNNRVTVSTYCTKHRPETLMSAIQKNAR